MNRPHLFIAAIIASATGATLAQVSVDAPPPAPTETTRPTVIERPAGTTLPATTPARPGLSTQPSAESVLENLLKNQTPGNTTQPGATRPDATSDGGASLEMINGLIPEGAMISARNGHLEKEADGRFKFVFDPDKSPLPAMEVVPSRRLAALEEASDGGKNPVRFTIDGQVTQYRGKNFLYLTDTLAVDPLAPATSTAPATQRAVPAITGVAPNEPPPVRVREETTLYNRVGRLVTDEKTGATVFAFDTDGKEMYDPPMALVPSRYLAIMEDASKTAATPMKFRVSGRITQYHGKNYLLLTFVQAVRDLNQGLGG